MNVNGHAAVVSGGASGLGAATARRLAKLGVKIGILDRDAARAEAVAAEIGGVAAPCDVADSDGADHHPLLPGNRVDFVTKLANALADVLDLLFRGVAPHGNNHSPFLPFSRYTPSLLS